MRTHRSFSALQPWSTQLGHVRELVSAERLAVMRLEPITRAREASLFADLYFSDGTTGVCLPLVYVDLAQLDVRELDPLVFPRWLEGVLADDRARDVIARVFPDLEYRAATGGFRREETVTYGDATLFERARARGFFGAAPLAQSLPRVAGALYARRFATNKHVAAYGPQALECAAFVRDVATFCTVVDGEDDLMSTWYGRDERPVLEASYDLALGSGPTALEAATFVRLEAEPAGLAVEAVAPLPADLMVSFDPADGPAAARFTVSTRREPFQRALAPVVSSSTVESSGRIAVVVRPDGDLVPDVDTDEATAFVEALRAEGFTAARVSRVDELEALRPDLVHLFGARPGAFALRVSEWTSERGVALALHAYYEQPTAGGYWGGLVVPYCFGYSADERNVRNYLEQLARRAVEVDGIGATTPYAPEAAGIADAERVLRIADLVFVNSERERLAVEPLRAGRPTYVVPPLPTITAPGGATIGTLVGADPFVLVHAPIGPLDNQLVLVRAVADVGAPLVLAGPVADPTYAERLREFAGDLRLFGEPTPEQAAALYRSAAVVADAAWTARGHGRLAAAAALGASIVVSQARWIDLPVPERWIVDPADVTSVTRAIGAAWDAASQRASEIQRVGSAAADKLGIAAATIVAAYATIPQRV